MDSFQDFVEKITSSDIPAGVLAVAGFALILLAVRVARRSLKLAFVLLGLAALAGAICWHFGRHR